MKDSSTGPGAVVQPGYLVEIVVPAVVLARIPEDSRRFMIGPDHYLFTACEDAKPPVTVAESRDALAFMRQNGLTQRLAAAMPELFPPRAAADRSDHSLTSATWQKRQGR